MGGFQGGACVCSLKLGYVNLQSNVVYNCMVVCCSSEYGGWGRLGVVGGNMHGKG